MIDIKKKICFRQEKYYSNDYAKDGGTMKSLIRLSLYVVAVALIINFTAGPAPAQDKPADTMQLVLEKLRADKKLLIAENMKLTESEAAAFWPVYDNYQVALSELGKRYLALIEDYAGNYQNMEDAAAKKLLDDYIAIQSDRLKLMRSYLPEFRKVLPEKKVALYYQLENKINAAANYELAEKIPLIQ